MSDRLLPLIVEPEQLETVLGHQRLVVLHITKPERYVQFHVPGAVFLEGASEELNAMLEQRGLTSDKEIICYCQSHHRSSHAYIMLKVLGYQRIKGYPGSWSAWGNHPDTPVE